ncbi:MAG: DUF565 domain-containing protein [Leptolyngbyaceae cyanobacterium SM1_1_3]|nr:DUF565 domain-containing protein [Leptolyngbyaceae cyanobacterium SM1_1_3]NJO10137.1 DUF565 domain-containing protein [Leptolyngbyaceae cyanobacterium SL_1_1]
MQNTRLSMLFGGTLNRFLLWVGNPWRRLSLEIISLLFGNFFAVAVSATAGQTADLDVIISALLMGFVELVSRLYYRRSTSRDRADSPRGSAHSVFGSLVNAFKVGLTYGLFVEAFKLGS